MSRGPIPKTVAPALLLKPPVARKGRRVVSFGSHGLARAGMLRCVLLLANKMTVPLSARPFIRPWKDVGDDWMGSGGGAE